MERGISILLIESDASLRALLKLLIEEAGFACEAVDDLSDSIEVFCAKKPRILVADLRMSNSTGLKMVETVKKIDHKFPVILMTAGIASTEVLNLLSYPRVMVLKKPVMGEVLLDALNSIQTVGCDAYHYQRKYFRVPVNIKATMGHFGEALLKNLSQGGVAFMTPTPIQVGDVVYLKFSSIRCPVRVVWNKNNHEYGGAFDRLSEINEKKITSLLIAESNRREGGVF